MLLIYVSCAVLLSSQCTVSDKLDGAPLQKASTHIAALRFNPIHIRYEIAMREACSSLEVLS